MPDEHRRSIFISHTSKDSQFARALSDALEKRGLGSWYVRLARTEEDVQRELEQALEQSSVYVFLLSEATMSSPWMFFELGAAMGTGKYVLPVYFSENAWRRARSYIQNSAADVRPINASDLKPTEVADRVVEALDAAA